jgi:hypothetical protein
MEMRKLILCGAALTATLALAAHAAAEEAEEPDEYVVYVDKVNVCAEPSPEAEVVKVLERGDRVADLGELVEYADGLWWRHVRVAGEKGWVADKCVLLARVFGAFKEADARGRAGDGEGMLSSVKEGCRIIAETQSRYPASEVPYCVSPDGRKVIVAVENLWDWDSGYPERSRMSRSIPVLFFEDGKGFADFTVYEIYETGDWFQGNRFYVYVGLKPEEEWVRLAPLRNLDTETGNDTHFGKCGVGYEAKNYEFADGFIIWSSIEDITRGTVVLPEYGEMQYKPVLMAHEFASGKITRVLEADMATMEEEHSGCYPCAGIYFFEVKMKPAGPVPEAVEKSGLYRRYNGGTGYVWSETGA